MTFSSKWTVLFIAAFSTLSAQAAPSKKMLLEEYFDRPGRFGKQLLTDSNVQLIRKGGSDGSDAIRVAYVGYDEGSKRVVSRFPLSRQVMEATLSFDVRFGEDFQWVKGGKLHGLGPEEPVTGGKDRAPEKWSARLMFDGKGHTKSYLYEQSPDEKYGVGGLSKAPVFKKGVWHKVVMRVKVNTPGKADGTFSVSVDGKEVNKESSVEFRGSDGKDTLISTMLFSTFHGGESSAWAPRDKAGKYTTVYADFDNFTVQEGPSD
jgi:hypothetical protein